MVDFKIKRGLSTTMFVSHGVINPRLIIEEGVWYLCTDTAELFLGVKLEENTENERLSLKRLNGSITPGVGPAEPDEDTTNLKFIVEELSSKVAVLEDIELFQKVTSEDDLPRNFDSEDFNPNITYYIHDQKTGFVDTYIYDNDFYGYLCTSRGRNVGLGIVSAEINVQGELVIHYSDGSSSAVGNVVGTDGLTVALKVGNKLYTQTNGIIELPEFATLEYVEARFNDLVIPNITKLSELENDVGFLMEQDLSDYATKDELPSTDGLSTEDFVRNAIAQAEFGESNIDVSNFVTKDVLADYATKTYVNKEVMTSLDSVILHGGDATPDD